MNIHFSYRWLCLCACLTAIAAHAISPAEVKQKLQAGEKITFVDLRSRSRFQAGHIPNAINIPAVVVAEKQLPSLGLVVAYDDGLGPDTAGAAVASLNARPGITALAMEGGFAAWESYGSAESTRAAGLSAEELPVITYQDLLKAQSNNVVLVDLRNSHAQQKTAGAKAAPGRPMTDLASEFPRAKVVRSPDAASGPVAARAAAPGQVPPLLVLIDNGDGAAQEMARKLKAGGNARFVILAGGEEMIVRKGEPGLERVGSSRIVEKPNLPANSNR